MSALGLAQICSWGTLYYSFPQMAAAMEADLGWTKSEIYGALTIGLLCSALSALPIGMLIDKGYGRLVMAAGSVLAGLLLIAWSQVETIFWFYSILAGIGVLQAATLYHAAFAVIVRNFSTLKTAEYITTLTLWGGFASTAFVPLIEFMLGSMDWRSVLIALGLVNLILCTGLYLMLPKLEEEPTDKTAKKAPEYSLKWVLRQPIFWALLVCFSLYSAALSAFGFHFYPILIEKGLSLEHVVLLLAIVGPSQVLGRLVIKVFASRGAVTKVAILTTSAFPFVFAAVAFLPTNFAMLIPIVVMYGAAKGIMTIVKGMAVPELLAKNAYGAINGTMNMPVTAVQAFAPAIAAFSWSVAQDYTLLLVSLIVTSVIIIALFALALILSRRAVTLQEAQSTAV